MRLQKKQDGPPKEGEEVEEATPTPPNGAVEVSSKKRKAESGEDHVRKRSKAGALPEDFFDEGIVQETAEDEVPAQRPAQVEPLEVRLPSRPATPLKTPPGPALAAKLPVVDENEWAAFEADIAAAEVPVADDAVISAPAMSNAEIAAKSREEESTHRKERLEAEMEGDKEDAARKLEEEFEEMEELESRMKKLKERREALRIKEASKITPAEPGVATTTLAKPVAVLEEDDSEDSEEDEDDWDGFRLKA
jgi:zinc finger protein 830